MNRLPYIEEISTSELAQALERRAGLQILDVRAPQRAALGHIDLGPAEDYINVPGSQITSMDPHKAGLDPERDIVVVCGRGHDSLVVAGYLTMLGYRARSMKGGMQAWNLTVLPRELPAPPDFERLIQFDRIAKGALGYLLISWAEAFAIDPPADYRPYLAAAQEAGVKITGVLDTHVHADYISGGPALARASGAPYYLHPADHVYPYDGTPGQLNFRPLSDGQEITVGAGTLKIVHTPGHTEGSVSVLASNAAAFTGDFLFISSIGRPDLAGRCAEWTPALLESVQRVRREWAPETLIYPAHYGSPDERNEDRSIGRSLGELMSSNASLQIEDPAQFSAWVESHISTPPESYRRIKAVNVGLHMPDEMEAMELESGRNECALK